MKNGVKITVLVILVLLLIFEIMLCVRLERNTSAQEPTEMETTETLITTEATEAETEAPANLVEQL